jgi:hypothetical protein
MATLENSSAQDRQVDAALSHAGASLPPSARVLAGPLGAGLAGPRHVYRILVAITSLVLMLTP